jgi:hypothetical protein
MLGHKKEKVATEAAVFMLGHKKEKAAMKATYVRSYMAEKLRKKKTSIKKAISFSATGILSS